MRFFSWLTPPLIVAVVFSSLAGAVFTWWVNREEPLTVGYAITTTGTGTDTTTKSLIPGLTLRINDKDIPAIYAHVIKVSRVSGYAETFDLAVTFQNPPVGLGMPTDPQIFGSSFTSPTVLHSINCQPAGQSFKCTLGPLDGQGEYQLAIATDRAEPPSLMTTGKDVRLASLGQLATEGWTPANVGVMIQFASILIFLSLLLTTIGEIGRKLFKWLRTE
jgi:hypothetical protein